MVSSSQKENNHEYMGFSRADGAEGFLFMAMLYTGPALIGFIFLIWMSSAFIWFLSLSFAFIVCLIHYLLLYTKKGLSEDAGISLHVLAVCFAAVIYFSAPFTDSGTYCGKQVYTSFSPELTIDRKGRYAVEDKMSTRWGREGCDSGTVNTILLVIFVFSSLWFFIKTIILFSKFYLFNSQKE